jgi:enoyl-[acyl-carrier protein] reductase I
LIDGGADDNGFSFDLLRGSLFSGVSQSEFAVPTMSLLAGKIGLVVGVANKRSIAWAIAQAWHKAGATLAFTYQGERLKENVEELAGTFGQDTLLLPCDVTKDEEIVRALAAVGEIRQIAFAAALGRLRPARGAGRNFFEHHARSVSRGARRERLFAGRAGPGSRAADDRRRQHSLHDLLRLAKVVPHYNVMGVAKAALEASTRYLAYDLGPHKIRVNCISAGPVNTLAARGIAGFSDMLKHYERTRH